MKLYLDTSVINGLFAYETPWRIEATELLFDKVLEEGYQAFVSELVLAEIEQTRNLMKRQQLLSVVEEYNLERLAVNERADQLAGAYVSGGIIPQVYEADAMHIAIATFYNVDILVSWNFEHMVKYETKVGVNKINRKLKYPRIEILSPEEV